MDWLRNAGTHGHQDLLTVFIRLCVAFVLGLAVAFICRRTHGREDGHPSGFLTTLVLLSVLIAAVSLVIGDSVARAFSLVGALAIVRFRTVVADTRDTAFVIFAVVEGMASGVGQLEVALAGLVVGGIAAFLMRPRGIRAAPEWRLNVRIGVGHDPAPVESIVARTCPSRDLRGTSTTRQGAAVELAYAVRLAGSATPAGLVTELNGVPGVQQVELVRA